MGIKVKATLAGLYGHYREPGHVFEIEHEKHFSSRWMKKLDAEGAGSPAKGKGKGKGKAKAELEPESEDDADAEGAGSPADSDVI